MTDDMETVTVERIKTYLDITRRAREKPRRWLKTTPVKVKSWQSCCAWPTIMHPTQPIS